MTSRAFKGLATAALIGIFAASEARAASLLVGSGDETAVVSILSPHGAVSKRINIDGRPVDITVQVANLILGAAPGGRTQSPTGVRVDLSSVDSGPLPEVTAVRIRLDRVRPPTRVVRLGLLRQPDTFTVPNVANAGYVATMIASFAARAELRATVTIVTPDETRIVRVGNVRVRPPVTFAPISPITRIID